MHHCPELQRPIKLLWADQDGVQNRCNIGCPLEEQRSSSARDVVGITVVPVRGAGEELLREAHACGGSSIVVQGSMREGLGDAWGGGRSDTSRSGGQS